MEKPAVTQYHIHELLKNRWSPRAFSQRPVQLETLFSLFEAARWAPSGGNLQPWAFLFTTAGSQAHEHFTEILSENNRVWAVHAPILALSVTQRDREPGKPNAWALYDLGQSVAHLVIQAEAEGLSVHQIGGYDRVKARQLFEIPEGYDPAIAIALGYQGSLEDLPEGLQQRELQARSRKPLESFVFEGRWNEPVGEQKAFQV